MGSLRIDADMVKRQCADPTAVANALGLDVGARPQADGLMVLCPWHGDEKPSCSLTPGPDGTLRVNCFACGKGGDVFSLTAHVLGLDIRREFPRVVRETAGYCGVYIDDANPARRPIPPRRLTTPPTPRRPPLVDVGVLWLRCLPVCDNPALARQAEIRGLDPAVIADRDLARSLPLAGLLPRWAWCNGRNWRDSGHMLLVPLYDSMGEIHSVHARSLQPDIEPKGLSPGGHSSAGLVMACSFARELLTKGIPRWWRHTEPPTIIIAEGVPDFLTVASHYGDFEYAPATIGVISGAWSKSIAARIPDGSRVVIKTHSDIAGVKYQRVVAQSLYERCRVEVPRHE